MTAYFVVVINLDTKETSTAGPFAEFDARWRVKWQWRGNQTRLRPVQLVKVKLR